MNATGSRIAGWGIRLLVAVGLYVAIVLYWVDHAAVGWERLGLAVAASMFGIAAATSWCVAIIVEHLFVSNVRLRLVAHPLVVAGLFVLFGLGAAEWYMGNSIADAWSVVKDFLLLVAICALIDACVGFLLAKVVYPIQITKAAARALRTDVLPRDRR